MKQFQIFIDSCGEMPRELREPYGVEAIPMTLTVNGKDDIKELPALIDYDGEYDFHSFYQAMRNGTRFKTAAINAAEFEPYFRSALEKGEDILYLACSSGLSISVKEAAKLAQKLMVEFPGSKIHCIDTLTSGFGIADMAITARNMEKEGKTIDEIAEYIESIKKKYNQFATVENLNYLKDAGRVTASSAFFGNLFRVCPIIISDAKGHNVAMIKVKGRKAALDKCVELAAEAAEDAANRTVYIAHGDCEADAQYLKTKVEEAIKPKNILVGKIGPIIGASSGPGVISVYVFGKEVTFCGE
ncbi:MAG: DegV family protein [Bacilli bacterium]|nr:DegV family protein [Bacilli bacterium]